MKKLEDYMKIPYRIEMELIPHSDGGGILARIPLLKGCMSDGETYDEAAKKLEDAKKEWFSYMLENGYDIPEPTDENYSGKFTLRVPKTLHKQLSERADDEGVSINQLAVYMLSFQLGRNEEIKNPRREIELKTLYNVSELLLDKVTNWNDECKRKEVANVAWFKNRNKFQLISGATN